MRKSFFVILGTIGLSISAFTQSETDSLVLWSSKFLDKQFSDETKLANNELFIDEFTSLLESKKSFDRTFPELNSVSVQTSPDKSFRIFTWFVITKTGYKTFGLLQATNPKIKNAVVTRLNDQGEDLRSAQFKTLNAKSWFGALYYDMIPFKIKGKKYHLLLGFNPGNGLSHKKVVDVVQIMNNGQPRFGAAIFEKDKKTASRIVLEYDARAKISLRYIDQVQMVVFDHLSPSRPEFVDQYEHYVPDLSYDAFELTKTGWKYLPDVKPLNPDENAGSEGVRLVIPGVNDEETLKNKMSGGSGNSEDKKEKEKTDQ